MNQLGVIVTGANGFLGSAIVKKISSTFNSSTIALVRENANLYRLRNANERVKVLNYSDLSNVDNILVKIDACCLPQVMIHSAWEGVSGASRDKDLQSKNILLTQQSIDLAVKIGCKHWIGIGSQAEYKLSDDYLSEESDLEAMSSYAEAKLACFKLARSLCDSYGLKFTWLRVFDPYGPKDNEHWFIPYLINSLKNNKAPELTQCEQVWDYIYIDDAASAIMHLAQNSYEGIFNIASGQPVVLKDVVAMVQEIMASDTQINWGACEYKQYQVMCLKADISKLRATGWEPKLELRQGLKKTVEYFMKESCRLCGVRELKQELTLNNSPKNISKLLSDSELEFDSAINLNVYRCGNCGFVQLVDELEHDFYEDYIMTTTHSAQMNEFQKEQAQNFVKKYKLENKKIIEVGCGDGNYLLQLGKFAKNIYGVEPSIKSSNIGKQLGLTIYNAYTHRDEDIKGAPYDAFVTRQVLEHIPDIDSFLQGVKRSLAPNAVGLIEVPSLEQTIVNNRFFDFFTDHLNYFSEETLRFALEKNGFELLEINRAMNGEYLEAYVSLPKSTKDLVPTFPMREYSLINLQLSLDSLAKKLNTIIEEAKRKNKKLAFWGAGAKGITLLATTKIKNDIEYVVDSDPYKQGLYLPISHLPIVHPDKIRRMPVDIVIVTALAYYQEIVKILTEDLGFTGELIVIEA